jgi:hypothetical protein
MASQLANKIAHAVLATDADQPSVEVAIDAQLAEVREVLGLLSRLRVEGKPCWCESAFRTIGDHDANCQRTSALYEKLRVDQDNKFKRAFLS